MKKIEAWLSKKGLKNKRTLIVVIAFVYLSSFYFYC
ncbi:LytH protein involved in methicillin resistance / N-acetylmuramoyl-L-alanine amidase domain protein [Staphylococcus aureus]|uniref:LytH protein involved in methicillin resistance / N-acetylmuramoyl-L-alanine amidase domain protein n=1 Tax=Staphylococcus aureus TaxID=1280 RepID=A0A380E2C5_STAAU|nr:LytH protein involved in methicillin resistance / N-acetylmuramoyl-L-alanine amidase domain protein [Staphylococcus aureus]